MEPDRVRILLLDRNLETVYRAVLECSGEPATGTRRTKPSPDERDIVLRRATGDGTLEKGLRGCVLDRVPSLAYVVTKLAEALVGRGVFSPRTGPTDA